MQDKDYSDEHKHCTMQPFDSAMGAQRGQTFELGKREIMVTFMTDSAVL